VHVHQDTDADFERSLNSVATLVLKYTTRAARQLALVLGFQELYPRVGDFDPVASDGHGSERGNVMPSCIFLMLNAR
jgi:hypothetical protein